MVSFEFSKEIEKDVFHLIMSVDKEKKHDAIDIADPSSMQDVS